ncbi:intermembrane lipid transfer protein VPS13C [Salvelinus sp. IW2-2015]|uniref:intermembrane lipid transfer protein VPS13C n=1 Tax=Salvelinus sp. IW2-2015 TaxID=2691554 RepID=UPI0038D39521
MKVALSQDDLKVLLRILMENIGEASGLQPDQHTSPDTTALKHKTTLMLKTDYPKDGVENMVELPEQPVEEEPLETMKFIFNIESLGLVLYSNDPKQVCIYRGCSPVSLLMPLNRYVSIGDVAQSH